MMLSKTGAFDWMPPRGGLRVLLLVVLLALELPAGSSPANEPRYAPRHLLVRLKTEVEHRIAAGEGGLSLDTAAANLGFPAGTWLEEPAVARLMRMHDGLARPSVRRPTFYYLRLPADLSVPECVLRLRDHPAIDFAEPDWKGTGGLIPNDPNFGWQWHHRNMHRPTASIQTPRAWDRTTGSSNVIVAVLDSGLQVENAEFAGRVVDGFNFVSNTANVFDDEGHGTAVTGVVAAHGNNWVLVAGVDWQCRILPVKVLNAENIGLYSWFAQGIDYAVWRGAKVINFSIGGWEWSEAVATAITNAIARGVIFVTITHNDGTNMVRFPGNLPESITVGATDERDRRCLFSNYGPQIDLVAPGTNIFTAGISGGLERWWGTSFAAPQVAGACSLLASVRANLTQKDALSLLAAGADDTLGDAVDVLGFDVFYGWGRLNVANSMLLAETRVRRLSVTNGVDILLEWDSPANAASKQPYRVESAIQVQGPWFPITDSGQFTYGARVTWWRHPGAVTNNPVRFYRVRVRDY